MEEILNIGLDLGGDTLKIAFAYREGEGFRYGKFAGKSKLTQIAIPAIAYFNRKRQMWSFGDQVGKNGETFITVVKIKSLISLLTIKGNTEISNKNKGYYFYGKEFPKFYFPTKRKMLDDFDEMVSAGQTFCGLETPQRVCQMFFDYIKALIDIRKKDLELRMGIEFSNQYKIAIVHPSSVGEEYITEISDLVKNSFGYLPDKILSSNKALAINAFHRADVKIKGDFLVFDMGEEDISVVRAGKERSNIVIDGVDGHNEPIGLGGIDIDEAIVKYLATQIGSRETMGSPSSGVAGHISEGAVYDKQYLLMKDIKKAKVIFSKPIKEESIFADGVPVTLSWDLCIQRRLTKENVKKCIGVQDDNGVAKRIADYIISEIERPLNRDIKDVFISGGLTETYSLIDYLREKVKEVNAQVTLHTFDDYKFEGEDFDILSYEDSVFAPAVGGAIVALEDIKIKMVTSLSYGTWVHDNGIKILKLFVERGAEIKDGKEFVTETFNTTGWGLQEGEEMFSTYITRKDIKSKKLPSQCSYTQSGELMLGEPGSLLRKVNNDAIGLKVVAGGKKGKISFCYGGYKVRVLGSKINFVEGVKVDKNGKATPIIKNVSNTNYVTVQNMKGATVNARADKVLLIFEGIDEFSVAND